MTHDPTDHDCKGGVRGDRYPLDAVTATVNEPARQLREWIGEMFVHQRDAHEVIRILDAALAAERAIGAEALDVEAVASVLCSMRHGGSTDLATCLRAATDRADASMFVNRYARLTRERNGQ